MPIEALAIDGVSLEYVDSAVTALWNVFVRIEEGEFVAILGPSGCGKSSLLHLIAGFIAPTSGLVSCFGTPVVGPAPDRGVLFQKYSLFPWKTALGNVSFPLRCKGLSEETAHSEASRWLGEVGLLGFEDFYPARLSGGMQQRVALARLFASDPRVFLMDEPFGALDSQSKMQAQELLLDLWERHRKTIIFVTHDVEEALFLADRVFVLSGRPGTVIEEFAVPLSRPRITAALYASELVCLRQHVESLMQQEQTKLQSSPKAVQPASDTRVVRVGFVPDVTSLPLLAAARDLVANGEPSRLKLFAKFSGDVIIDAVISGRLDFGEVSLVSAVIAARRGLRFKILSGWGTIDSNAGDLVNLVLSDSSAPLGPQHESAFRNIAINGFSTLSEFVVRRAFQRTGQGLKCVSMRPETFAYALTQNVISGAVAMEPWTSALRNKVDATMSNSLDAYLPPDPLFVLIANSNFLQASLEFRSTLMDRLTVSWGLVRSDANLRRRLIKEDLGVDLGETYSSFSLQPAAMVGSSSLETTDRLLAEVGMLRSVEPVDWQSLANA